MTDVCPRLREVVDVIDRGALNENDLMAFLENLLAFFFSPLSTELNDNDVMWFLGYMNTLTSVDICQEVIEVEQDVDLVLEVGGEDHHPVKDQSPLLNALSTAMAKRVLGEILTHPQGVEKPVPPLSIFHRKVGTSSHMHRMTVIHTYEGHLHTYYML